MRHLRSAALAVALLALAAMPAAAHSAAPPGPAPQTSVTQLDLPYALTITPAVICSIGAELLAELPQPVALGEHVTDAVHAIEASGISAPTRTRQRARAPATSRQTRFAWRLLGPVLGPVLVDTNTGRIFGDKVPGAV